MPTSSAKLPIRFGHKVFYVSKERAITYYSLEGSYVNRSELARIKMELLKAWGVWDKKSASLIQFPNAQTY